MKSKTTKEFEVHVRIEFIAEEYNGAEMELVKEINDKFTVTSDTGIQGSDISTTIR